MRRDAVLSDCGRYRYRLFREWEASERMPVMWLMLNPSTADASIDDPTIRRCMAFSKAWGYGAMWVGNLYAFRSTDPYAMLAMAAVEARGPDNDRHLYQMSTEAALIVLAWGVHGGMSVPLSMAAPGGLWCLGKTKHGAPKHPLYVKGDTPLQEWDRRTGLSGNRSTNRAAA